MNREIKFRAWHQKYKVMEYNHTPFPYDSDYWDGVCCTNLEIINNQLKVKSILFMQYTGLKDKNGIDIYEGDVVIYETFSCDGVMYKDTYYVIYEAPMFKLKAIQSHIFKPGAYIYFDNNIEVIGNIYENPELLTNE